MPQTATQTRASMANRTHNASRTVAGGPPVHVTLTFDGVLYRAEDIFDALEAKYGSGKVSNVLDQAAGNRFHLRIKP